MNWFQVSSMCIDIRHKTINTTVRPVPHHHHHHHLRVSPSFRLAWVGRFLHTRPLHLTQSKAHFWCKSNSTKCFFTHSSRGFLPLPLSLTPLTSKLLHAETQSSLSCISTRPNYCSLLHCTTSRSLQCQADCWVQHWLFYSSSEHHTSTWPSFVLVSPFLPYPTLSLPKFHSHIPKHCGYRPCKLFLSLWEKLPLIALGPVPWTLPKHNDSSAPPPAPDHLSRQSTN